MISIPSPAAVPSLSKGGHRHRFTGGFSLVEVTLAVAVASLAIITLLGLLPQGLEMARKTSLATSNSSIVEQIIRDLENVSWDRMPAATGTPLKMYFNDQGIDQTKSGSSDITYVAEVSFQPASLPKSESTQNYLRRVVIKIAASSNKNFKFEDQNRGSFVIFNHLIAKTR